MSDLRFEVRSSFEDDTFVFANVEEVNAWYRNQRDEFAWILQRRTGRFAQQLAERIENHLVAIGNVLTNIANAKKDQHPRLQNDLADALGNWKNQVGILGQSEITPLLKSLSHVSADLAAKTLLAHTRPQDQNDDGRLVLTLWKLGFLDSGNLNNPQTVYEERRMLWDTQLHALRNSWDKMCGESKRKSEEIAELGKLLLTSIEQRRKEVDEDLKAFQDTVETSIALKAPVEHWQKLADECSEKAKQFALAFGCTLLIGIVFITVFVGTTWPQDNAQSADKIWSVTTLLLLAGAVTWPLRLLAKLTMSNIHLSADATERAITIKAYLALLHETEAILPDDKKIVLATIFRTAATGIVHDDGSPNGGLELLSKLFK